VVLRIKPEELKASILQYAIEGRLVEQRAEEGTAEELYKQIRAEKQKLIKEGKIKKEKPLPEITEDDNPFDIPESWKWVRLNDIVYNHGQKTPDNVFSYIDIGSIDNIHQRLNDEETLIEAEKAPSRARKIVTFDDILYATVRPYLHNTCIIDKEFKAEPIASTGFAVLTCHKGLFNKYLFYYLLSPVFDRYANSTDNAKGMAYPAINDNKLYRGVVPLPPLAEQRRIVAKIEELLPYVDRYAEAYDRLEQFYDKFPEEMKKSVLQYAIEGRLVEQRTEEGTAEELYKQIRTEKQKLIKEGKIKKEKPLPEISEKEIPFDIPESWKWVHFDELVSLYNGDRGKNYPNKSEYVKEGIAWINTGHILPDGYLDRDSMNYITEEKYNSLNGGKILEGDLVYCLRGATFGKVSRIEPFSKGAIASSLMGIRPIKKEMREFIYLFLKSPYAKKQLSIYENGSAQQNLAAKDVRKYVFPLPPLAEQRRIVAKIEELLPLCERLAECREKA
jgi:type I restriction enzyme S subunit